MWNHAEHWSLLRHPARRRVLHTLNMRRHPTRLLKSHEPATLPCASTRWCCRVGEVAPKQRSARAPGDSGRGKHSARLDMLDYEDSSASPTTPGWRQRREHAWAPASPAHHGRPRRGLHTARHDATAVNALQDRRRLARRHAAPVAMFHVNAWGLPYRRHGGPSSSSPPRTRPTSLRADGGEHVTIAAASHHLPGFATGKAAAQEASACAWGRRRRGPGSSIRDFDGSACPHQPGA